MPEGHQAAQTGGLLDGVIRRFMPTIVGVQTKEPVAALTFDDGPDPYYTPRLLKLLQEHGARATFFMLGNAALQAPQVVRQVAEAGHAIGNHTHNHVAFTAIPSAERRRELRACARALAPYGQRLFRPPWGCQSLASRFDALLLGYQVICWNVSVGDWSTDDPHEIAERLRTRLRPGAIVLLHDALRTQANQRYAPRDAMLEGLGAVLRELRGRMRFVTVPELLRYGPPQRRNWLRSAQEYVPTASPGGSARKQDTTVSD